jgi:hypothetical protein
MNRDIQKEGLLDKPVVVPIGDLEAVTGAAVSAAATETITRLPGPTTVGRIPVPTKIPEI